MNQIPVRRRKLAEELRKIREGFGRTYDDVAAALDWSKSKMSRIENGHVSVRLTDLWALLNYYRVDGGHRERILALARQAKRKDPQPYMEGVSDEFSVYLGMEAEARVLNTYESTFVPGLLQTMDYMRAVFSASRPSRRQDEIERAVSLRLARQSVLTKEDSPELWAIVDESVVRRQLGNTQVMREQLEHLREMADLAHVTVQVAPFDKGSYFGMGSSFVIVQLSPEPGADVAFAQVPLVGGIYLEEIPDVARYTLAFTHLCSTALSDVESKAFIETVIKDL